jgi:hypothetical protein
LPDSKFIPLPKNNQYYCQQDSELNGYRIYAEDKTTELLNAVGKTVTTRSFYRIRRSVDGVAIASLEQDRLENKYHILGTHNQKIAEFQISKNGIDLVIGDLIYTSKSFQRGKVFDFKTKNGVLVMTVDKKLMSLTDTYHVVQSYDFPSLIAQITPIVIDDIYHH